MIQRKQTLFLLAVTIISAILIFTPFQYLNIDGKLEPICLMPGCSPEIINSGIYAPMILNLLSLILSLIIIFQYKNRVLQYKLSNLVVLINVFVIGLFFLLTYTKDGVTGTLSFSFGAFLPSISVIFAFLAAHFIKKDEELVRSADRIR